MKNAAEYRNKTLIRCFAPVFLLPNRNYSYFCNRDARRSDGAARQRSNRAADGRRNGRYPTLEKGNG